MLAWAACAPHVWLCPRVGQVTNVGALSWDEGWPGIMRSVAAAVAGDERPFILVPRDGCDVVVLGSRYVLGGSYKWGVSTGLDLAMDVRITALFSPCLRAYVVHKLVFRSSRSLNCFSRFLSCFVAVLLTLSQIFSLSL